MGIFSTIKDKIFGHHTAAAPQAQARPSQPAAAPVSAPAAPAPESVQEVDV